MNNNENGFERALEIIRRDSKNRPIVGCCGGITGPTGPTHTLLSESKWYFLTIFLI